MQSLEIDEAKPKKRGGCERTKCNIQSVCQNDPNSSLFQKIDNQLQHKASHPPDIFIPTITTTKPYFFGVNYRFVID